MEGIWYIKRGIYLNKRGLLLVNMGDMAHRSTTYLIKRGLCIVRKGHMVHQEWCIAHKQRFIACQVGVYGPLGRVYTTLKEIDVLLGEDL